MKITSKAKFNVILSMVIYGTIGIFVKYIPMPSATISMIRGMIGAPFLLVILLFKKTTISWRAIKENLWRLLLLGVMLGFNWIFLFEAYTYTTIATATLCYYLAPIFIVIASVLVFKEKMTLKKVLCTLVAMIGMIFVCGIIGSQGPLISEIKGIILGGGAALLYAAIVINNKKLYNISAYDRTIAQLLISFIVLLPYNLISGNLNNISFSPLIVILLLIIGIIHTGLAYYLYFGAMDKLSSQSLAILSYIDPAIAIVISVCILKQEISIFDIIGAILILGAAGISEYTSNNRIIKRSNKC